MPPMPYPINIQPFNEGISEFAFALHLVNKEIEHRKLQYDNILGVRIGTMHQVNDLKGEIEDDAFDVKAVETKVNERDYEMTCLMLDIAKLQGATRMCVALCERVYTNGVEWMIGLLKGKVCQEGG